MANAPRDENRVTALLGVSNIDFRTPVDIQADPSTHELLVKANVSGTVTANAGTNLNTSALALENGNIASIELLTEAIQELTQRLMPLAGAMSNTAQLRTVVTGAVTATGGGYITSAQHVTNTLTQTTSLLGYNRMVLDNTLAIQSNINNCVVT